MVSMWMLYYYILLGDILRPVASSHFMGGLYRWRPVDPEAYDGRVQMTHRIAWRRGTTAGACTRELIESGALRGGDGGPLDCRSGCTGTIGDTQYSCTDFSAIDDWGAGERTYIYTFNRTLSYFEGIFESGNWVSAVINGNSGWQIQVKGSLTNRADTGLINSSPVVNMPPVIRLQQGCNHTIKVPVVDADGDSVRCRWAVGCLDECGGVCKSFPANLNERECSIQYTASGQTGRYIVALQIEDFASPSDTIPMSSIPLQFIVLVFSSNQTCSSQPEFTGSTPQDGSCIGVPFNTIWSAEIIAKIPENSIAESIVDIITASPLGMRKSELNSTGNPREWYVNVTWTPSTFQLQPNIFCFYAVDSILKSSTQSCITLLGGVETPMFRQSSISPKGVIFINKNIQIWSIEFDRQFIRPPRDRFIRIFEEERDIEVFSINVATSSYVKYPLTSRDRTLSFRINYQLPEERTFYILLDSGVAVGPEVCHPESPALTDPTLWTFTIADITPPRLQINDPLISSEGVTLSWSFNEEATSVCQLQSPSLTNMTVPCVNDSILLSRAMEGYSLFVEGVDMKGNIAEAVQFSWNTVTTITCGNVMLTDIELLQSSSATKKDVYEASLTTYHCAESVSMNETISVVCSSDGASRWNIDPSSHGCVVRTSDSEPEDPGREEIACSHIIAMISSPLSFVFGIVCGLLLYQLVKCVCSAGHKRRSSRLERIDANQTVQSDKLEELESNALYYEVIPNGRYSERSFNRPLQLEPNLAYGQFQSNSSS